MFYFVLLNFKNEKDIYYVFVWIKADNHNSVQIIETKFKEFEPRLKYGWYTKNCIEFFKI